MDGAQKSYFYPNIHTTHCLRYFTYIFTCAIVPSTTKLTLIIVSCWCDFLFFFLEKVFLRQTSYSTLSVFKGLEPVMTCSKEGYALRRDTTAAMWRQQQSNGHSRPSKCTYIKKPFTILFTVKTKQLADQLIHSINRGHKYYNNKLLKYLEKI